MKLQILNQKNSNAGASLVEMALLIALIAVIAIPSVSWMGESTRDKLAEVAHGVTGEGSFCDPHDPLCDD